MRSCKHKKAALNTSLEIHHAYLAELDNQAANEAAIISRAVEAWGLSAAAEIEKLKGAVSADAETENLAQALA